VSERAGLRFEAGRGVYDAKRAAALAGVPRRTLSEWARNGLYPASVAPNPYTRLWSWSDLLALRAIDWLRRAKPEGPPRVTVQKIRKALLDLDLAQTPREQLHNVVVTEGGELFWRLPFEGEYLRVFQATPVESAVRAGPGHQMVLPYALNLVAPYVGQKGRGPDLLTPRTLLRIIPGKLHGAPHVAGTRIPTAVLFTLAQQGYGVDDILEMYPDASREAVDQAIELEGSLQQAA
jgi:uncharacterized protein (DUF433 family)/DNA-binding transcriptional MerR regulator